MAATPDVTVLGGGPAGASAALLLAGWGHVVRLITRPPSGHGLAVSLPPSCAKLFDTIGVSGAVEGAGFVRSTGNTVWWGSDEARVETFAAGARGWQVEVGRLSAVLLEQAVAASVRIERASPGGETSGFVIDATGRAGVLAREKGLREFADGPRTIALVGEWHHDGHWPVPDDTQTLIESYDDGWMWSVPTSAGVRHIAAMVDPQRSALARGGSSETVYLAEIAKTRIFSRLTSLAVLHDRPRGWDASQYRARAYAGDGWLLAGDAGSFVDPLSSAGVKKALASGWLAAIVAHTCLARPAMRPHALEFFSARECEIEQHLSRESRRFLGDAAGRHRRPFWDERSEDAGNEPGDAGAVQRALARLKAQDGLQVRIAADVVVAPRPIIRGNEVVLEPHLVPPGDPRGVRYVREIDVVAMIELAPSMRSVPDLFDACTARLGSMSLHDFLFALATAVARGWVVSE